jgi:BlaR1 peptidase M56/Carboxypeptidase regulatory-like domain
MLLAHEWAHIRRGDLWLLAVSRWLLIVLFAHPLYWMLRRRLRFDQELLADAAAAQICGRQEYAECLFAWARRLPSRRLFPAGALGIWNRPGQLSRRIAMLLDERIRPQSTCSRIWKIAVASVATSLVIGISFVTLRPAPMADAASPIPKDDESKASKPTVPAEKTVFGVPSYDGGIAHRHAPEDNPAKSAPIAQVEMAAVSGTCVDEQQKPIANARVRLFRIDHANTPFYFPMARWKFTLSPSFGDQTAGPELQYESQYYAPASQRVLQETRSNEKGEFQFKDLIIDEGWRDRDDAMLVVAQAPGKASNWSPLSLNKQAGNKPQWTSPITLKMPKVGALRGRVTNQAGQPIAGAVVWKPGLLMLYKPVEGLACAITDADGRYEIADMNSGSPDEMPPIVTPIATIKYISLLLSVQHPDYADGVMEYSSLPATCDATLQPAATLRGRVFFDQAQEPAQKASVEVSLDNGTTRYVPVDETGKYSVSQLAPGNWHVRTWTLDRPSTTRSIDLHAGQNELDLRLPKGGTIKGRIVDVATGKIPRPDPRIGGISLGASIAGHDARESSQGYMSNEGTFSMVVQPGKNLIGLSTPFWKLVDEEQWKTKGVEVAAGQTVEIELRLASQIPVPPPLPKEPLNAKATLSALKMRGGAGIDFETIEGQEYVTVIYTQVCDRDGETPELPRIAWLEKNLLLNIKEFPKLRTLGLTNPDGGDAALESLRGVESLETLCIGGAPDVANQTLTSGLTMAAFDHFATLPNLKMLCVMSPHFDDRAFGYIDRWPKLEGLMLGGAFTLEGVKLVRGKSKLKQLEVLAMANAKLGDDCLDAIGTLANLEDLGLCDADEAKPSHWTVTNDGLAKLAGLTKLSSLTLQCPQITNAGLIHLGEMKSLKHLDLKGTAVTQAGIDELKKSLPKLEATGYQGWKPPSAETAAAPADQVNQPAKR